MLVKDIEAPHPPPFFAAQFPIQSLRSNISSLCATMVQVLFIRSPELQHSASRFAWVVASCLAGQGNSWCSCFMKHEVHHRVHKTMPLVPMVQVLFIRSPELQHSASRFAWVVASCLAGKENSWCSCFMKHEVHHRVHKMMSLVPILNSLNPFHTFTPFVNAWFPAVTFCECHYLSTLHVLTIASFGLTF